LSLIKLAVQEYRISEKHTKHTQTAQQNNQHELDIWLKLKHT